MKTSDRSILGLALLALVSTLNHPFSKVYAQGTAFTYQGRLNVAGNPANGFYDFNFGLYSAGSGGTQYRTTLSKTGVGVTNGLFTVALDFGSQFSGNSLWLDLSVRTNGVGAYTPVTPRQLLAPTPYAITAENLDGVLPASQVSGALPASQVSGTLALAQLPSSVLTNNEAAVNLTGTFSGNGAGVTNVALTTLNGQGLLAWPGALVPASTFSVGRYTWPSALLAADINGDGKPDLVTADQGGNTLTVLTNNGSGGFGFEAALNVDREPVSVAAADVNGDGKLDLISANWDASTLTIFTNNGSGGFGSNATLNVSSKPTCVLAVDVNGDGKPDLVNANLYNGTLTVWTNNGSGGFGSNTTLSVGSLPQFVTAADLNAAGRPDLICANGSIPGTLTVLTNNGSGGFGCNATLSVGPEPSWVVATDINGDGKPDLVSANWGNGTLTVLTNNGSGGFGSNATLNVFETPLSVVAADVNGDGKPDLICVSANANALMVLTNNGSGSFGANSTINVGNEPDSLVAFDVNGDGRVDVVCANSYDSTLTVLLNAPTLRGSFAGNGSGLTGLNASNITRGTLPLAQLPGPVVTNGEGGLFLTGSFYGNGGGLTNLKAVLSVTGNSDITASTVNGAVTLGDTATSANTASTMVKRDASGNFAAGSLSLAGNVSASTINVGPNSPALVVAGDDTTSYGDAKQITIQGNSDPNMQLELGYKTSGNYGVIQSIQQNTAFTVLALNPLGGKVGVGTAAPRSMLDVVGSVSAFGALRLGSEANAAPPNYPNNSDGSVGLVVRRLTSTGQSSGTVVARTDVLQLQRDGSNSGLQIAYPASCSYQTINAFGITSAGAQVTCVKYIGSTPPYVAGTITLFTDSQRVVHYDISFGNTYTHGHTCHVVLDRYDDGTTSDDYLVGTVTSSYNQ